MYIYKYIYMCTQLSVSPLTSRFNPVSSLFLYQGAICYCWLFGPLSIWRHLLNGLLSCWASIQRCASSPYEDQNGKYSGELCCVYIYSYVYVNI